MAASDINQIFVSGRLTRDPESRDNGNIAALSLASNSYFRRNGSDQTEEKTLFIDVSLFGFEAKAALAAASAGRLVKGVGVTVEGELELNVYKTSEGEDRRNHRIKGRRIHSDALRAPKTPDAATAPAEPVAEPVVEQAPTEDGIPF